MSLKFLFHSAIRKRQIETGLRKSALEQQARLPMQISSLWGGHGSLAGAAWDGLQLSHGRVLPRQSSTLKAVQSDSRPVCSSP